MSKNILSAAIVAVAATLSMAAQADNAAWLKAKQPALTTTAKGEAAAKANQPAAGSVAAWKQSKFPAVDGPRVQPSDTALSSHPKVGTQAGWKQAKFPHLQKTAR